MDLDEFSLLPLALPNDSREILRLHYQNYLSDPFYTSSVDKLQTKDEFINSRIGSIAEQHSKPGSLTGKLVLREHPETMVGYIVFNAPKPDLRTPEQKDKDLREQIDKRSDGQKKKDQVYKLKTEDRLLNERYLGQGFEGRFWTLEVLIIDENYQRKGLGSRLVKWGMQKVEERIRQFNADLSNEMEDGAKQKIDGVYLMASPKGAKTYEKAGFVRIGEKEVEFEGRGDDKYIQAWFIKRFE